MLSKHCVTWAKYTIEHAFIGALLEQEDAFACHMETICFWARYRRIGNEIHYSAGEYALLVPSVIPWARHVRERIDKNTRTWLFSKGESLLIGLTKNVIWKCVNSIIDMFTLRYVIICGLKKVRFCQYAFYSIVRTIFAYVFSMCSRSRAEKPKTATQSNFVGCDGSHRQKGRNQFLIY